MCIYWITELLRALTGIMLIKFRDIVNKENVNPCKYPFLISKKAMSTIDSPAEEIAGQAHRYLSPSTWWGTNLTLPASAFYSLTEMLNSFHSKALAAFRSRQREVNSLKFIYLYFKKMLAILWETTVSYMDFLISIYPLIFPSHRIIIEFSLEAISFSSSLYGTNFTKHRTNCFYDIRTTSYDRILVI